MHAQKVTDLAQYRAARQRPVSEICNQSAAFETVVVANMRFWFSLWRTGLRAMTGV